MQVKSIRPFIGARNFSQSRAFYQALGFEEKVLTPALSVFVWDHLSFYLQDAYVQDWIDNTMVFMEVQDVSSFWRRLEQLDLPSKFPGVRYVPIREMEWGRECFIHDPSGILWHVGEFA